MNPNTQRTELWTVDHVACPLTARDAAGAIDEIARTLKHAPGVVDLPALTRAVQVRETHASTYLGGGVAIPHARTDAVDHLVIGVGLSREGLRWGPSIELARLVFLIGVPRDDDQAYLAVVRRITQTVRRLAWIEAAVTCSDAPALVRLLRDTIAFD